MASYAILLAAGKGIRFGEKTPKCFLKINNKYIYQYSLDLFEKCKLIDKTVLVVPQKYVSKIKISKKRLVVCGGKTRNESFENGIKALKKLRNNDKIIVHDAARINLKQSDLIKLIKLKTDYATLCFIGKANKSDYRIEKYNIQTPQYCLYSIYKNAIKNKCGKDLFSYLSLNPTNKNFILSSNKEKNFKITFKSDLLQFNNIKLL